MAERQPADGPNPYESPREHGYVSPEFQAQRALWWAWIKDRLFLWGCGCASFVVIWGTLLMVAAVAWWLGYPFL